MSFGLSLDYDDSSLMKMFFVNQFCMSVDCGFYHVVVDSYFDVAYTDSCTYLFWDFFYVRDYGYLFSYGQVS